jgi:hypothetical protein
MQQSVHFFYQTFSGPLAEITVNQLPLRVFFGEHPPLYAAFSNVKQGI